MRKQDLMAVGLVAAMATQAGAVLLAAPRTATLAGTAKDEATKPFTDFTVQAREVEQGHIVSAVPLDKLGNFALAGLTPGSYLVELLNRQGKVVCTEGPIALQKITTDERSDVLVVISCGHLPAAWWLLSAAGAAGVTSGVVAGATASPAR